MNEAIHTDKEEKNQKNNAMQAKLGYQNQKCLPEHNCIVFLILYMSNVP